MKTFTFDWQTFERSYAVAKGLLVKADAYTYTGRINPIILNNMATFYCSGFSLDSNSDNSNVILDFTLSSPGILTNAQTSVTVPLPTTPEAINAAIRQYAVGIALSAFSLTIAPSDVVFDNPGYAAAVARSFSIPSLAINTSRQASTTRDAMVNASVDITTTLSLTGGTSGKVELKIADDSAFTTNIKTLQSYTNSNTGALTIGLNTSQIGSASLTGIVPAGKYYRLVTTNITGTPTFGTPQIQEVLL